VFEKFELVGLVFQYARAFGLDIVKLPPVYGPPQTTQYEKHQADRQRNEQVQNVHGAVRTWRVPTWIATAYGLAMTMYSSTALQRRVCRSVELALRYQFAKNAPIALH
jgi:hypothetical protein